MGEGFAGVEKRDAICAARQSLANRNVAIVPPPPAQRSTACGQPDYSLNSACVPPRAPRLLGERKRCLSISVSARLLQGNSSPGRAKAGDGMW